MNLETGEVLWETRIADGGVLGGIEWGFATDGEVVYASISEAMEKAPGDAGGVVAVQVSDGAVVWGCFRHQVLLRRDRHVHDGSGGRPARVSEHPHVA